MAKKEIYVINSKYGPIYMERESMPKAKTPASITRDAGLLKIKKPFEEAMVNIETMYMAMFDSVKRLSPDEFNLEVGVKFNMKTGFFVLSAGTDVEFKVGLKWDLNNSKNVVNQKGQSGEKKEDESQVEE